MEAEDAGFFSLDTMDRHLNRNCGNWLGSKCKNWRCFQCGIYRGEQWNPHLPETRLGYLNWALNMVRGSKADTTHWTKPWPKQVRYAAEVKDHIGRDAVKEASHWGKLAVLPEHFEHELKQCQLDVCTVLVAIKKQKQSRFRLVCDACNNPYAHLLREHQWSALADAGDWKAETRGDLLDCLMARACLGPYLPTTLAQASMQDALRLQRQISRETMELHVRQPDWRPPPTTALTLRDQEMVAIRELELTQALPQGLVRMYEGEQLALQDGTLALEAPPKTSTGSEEANAYTEQTDDISTSASKPTDAFGGDPWEAMLEERPAPPWAPGQRPAEAGRPTGETAPVQEPGEPAPVQALEMEPQAARDTPIAKAEPAVDDHTQEGYDSVDYSPDAQTAPMDQSPDMEPVLAKEEPGEMDPHVMTQRAILEAKEAMNQVVTQSLTRLAENLSGSGGPKAAEAKPTPVGMDDTGSGTTHASGAEPHQTGRAHTKEESTPAWDTEPGKSGQEALVVQDARDQDFRLKQHTVTSYNPQQYQVPELVVGGDLPRDSYWREIQRFGDNNSNNNNKGACRAFAVRPHSWPEGAHRPPPASVLLLTIVCDTYHRAKDRGAKALAACAADAVTRLEHL